MLIRSSLIFLALTATAVAADVTTPVSALMDIAVERWAEGSTSERDYFDEKALATLYSADLIAAYRAAERFPAFDTETGTGSPFDYDVIVAGQDGCPLEEIDIRSDMDEGGPTLVDAHFKPYRCFTGNTEEERNVVRSITFTVISEGGRKVIDDFVTDGASIKETLKEIAAQ